MILGHGRAGRRGVSIVIAASDEPPAGTCRAVAGLGDWRIEERTLVFQTRVWSLTSVLDSPRSVTSFSSIDSSVSRMAICSTTAP